MMNEIVVAFLENSLWPIVVLFGFFIFKSPLDKFLSSLKSLKTGSVEVVFDERLKRLNLETSQLAALRDLGYEEISLFLLVSYSDDPEFQYELGISPSKFHTILDALEAAGLIEVSQPDDLSNKRFHSITTEGKRVRSIIIESITRLFQEQA